MKIKEKEKIGEQDDCKCTSDSSIQHSRSCKKIGKEFLKLHLEKPCFVDIVCER